MLGLPLGNAVALLCSEEASWITGQLIAVDGGAGLMDAALPLEIQQAVQQSAAPNEVDRKARHPSGMLRLRDPRSTKPTFRRMKPMTDSGKDSGQKLFS